MTMTTTLTDIHLHAILTQDDVKGLVFDLDGTLIDSAADILASIRETFRLAGYGEVPDTYFPDNLHGTSEGIMRSVIHDMGWQQPLDMSELKQLYYRVYVERGHHATQLYPGVLDVLRGCAETLPMAICTNKIHRNALAVTELLQIQSHFAVISGADSWAEAKPSPVPLLETIRAMGLKPEQCLYFGDTSVDAQCASGAGVRFVLHRAGYGDSALRGMSHYHAFDAWSDLMQI